MGNSPTEHDEAQFMTRRVTGEVQKRDEWVSPETVSPKVRLAGDSLSRSGPCASASMAAHV